MGIKNYNNYNHQKNEGNGGFPMVGLAGPFFPTNFSNRESGRTCPKVREQVGGKLP